MTVTCDDEMCERNVSKFMDDDTAGETLKTDTVTGALGQEIDYITLDKINDYE